MATDQTDKFLEYSSALLFILTFTLLVWVVVTHDAFGAALAGFLLGLNAVKSTRDMYAVYWRLTVWMMARRKR